MQDGMTCQADTLTLNIAVDAEGAAIMHYIGLQLGPYMILGTDFYAQEFVTNSIQKLNLGPIQIQLIDFISGNNAFFRSFITYILS